MWYLLKSSVRQGENHRTWKGPATSVENSSKRKRKSRLKWNFFGLEDSLNSSWGPRRKEWRAQGKFFIALICDCSSARVTTIRFQLTPTCELHCPEIDSLSSATIYPWNLPKFFFWGFLKVDREVWSSRVSHHIFLTSILSSMHNLYGWGNRFQFDWFSLFNPTVDHGGSWTKLNSSDERKGMFVDDKRNIYWLSVCQAAKLKCRISLGLNKWFMRLLYALDEKSEQMLKPIYTTKYVSTRCYKELLNWDPARALGNESHLWNTFI